LRDNGKTEEDEPMWGFCMMLTGYSRAAKDNIDRAMRNLLRLQEQYLGANADLPDVYADETYRPMSFDVLKTRLRALHATGCVGVSVSSPESLSFATTKTTIRRSGGGAIFCVSGARQRLLEDVEEYMGIKCG
jgi:glutamine synthetase adenylyltransferase